MKNNMPNIAARQFVSVLFAAVLSLAAVSQSAANDVSLVVFSKEQRFMQTNATTTVLSTNAGDGAFDFYAFVQGTNVVGVSAFNVLTPSEVVEFVDTDGLFVLTESFLSNAELEAGAPRGSYRFEIVTGTEGTFSPTLSVPTAAYPNTPRVLNWTDAQNVNPLADFTLSWTPMTGGSARDFVLVTLSGETNDVFRTPFLLEPGQLTGLSNSVVIPANTLESGQTYLGTLTSVNFVSVDTNAIPGAQIMVGFVKETEFSLTAELIPPQGRIQFASTNLVVTEDGEAIAVVLDRVGGSQGDVYVQLSSTGITAIAGEDYSDITHRVAFPDGVDRVTVTLGILDDFILEGPERIRLGLANPEGGVTLTRDTNAVVTIIDNESAAAGLLSFSAAGYDVSEAAEATVKVIVRRTGGTTGAVGATLSLLGGSATSGEDYQAVNENRFTIAIPDGQAAATNVITILDDSLAEGDETILLQLNQPTGGCRLGSLTNATVTIVDDEIAIQFAQSTYTNIENKAVALITLVRSGPVTEAASVDYSTDFPVTLSAAANYPLATPDVDFVATNGTLVFPPRASTASFAVRILDDLLVEPGEITRLTLSNPTNALLGPLDHSTLLIKDNDLGGTIQFTLTNQTVKEASGNAKIIVIRTGGLASNVTVRLSTIPGSASDEADYVGFSSNLVFGAKEGKKTVPLIIIRDALVEPIETLSLRLDEVSENASLGIKTNLTLRITDDDKGGSVSFDKPLYTVNEGAGAVSVVVRRSGGAASNVTVRLFTENGTATAGADYTALDTVLTFGAGETAKTNLLTILDDSEADGLLPETINLKLRDITGGARLTLSNAVASIVDNESSISFRTNAVQGFEGTTVTLELVRGGFLGGTSRVDYAFSNVSATNGIDYTGIDGTVTFLPGQVLKTITAPLIADPNAETNETFTVTLRNPAQALYGAYTNVTVTVKDAPDRGAISGSGPAFFTAVITGIEGNPVRKTISIANNPPNTISSAYTTSLGSINEISGMGNKSSLAGTSVRLVSNWLQFFNVHATGPGVVNIGSVGGQGAAVWNYNDNTGSTVNEHHSYDSGRAPGSGTITIDVLDTETRVIAGRFDFIAVEDGGTRKVHVTGSFRSTGTLVN